MRISSQASYSSRFGTSSKFTVEMEPSKCGSLPVSLLPCGDSSNIFCHSSSICWECFPGSLTGRMEGEDPLEAVSL